MSGWDISKKKKKKKRKKRKGDRYPEDAEPKDLLVNILTHIGGEREHKLFPVQDLEKMPKRILKEKSCLIVIEDVRTRNDFDKLQILLQSIGVRTRVVIITCDKDVAIVASGKNIPLQLRSLTDKESWKIFLEQGTHSRR